MLTGSKWPHQTPCVYQLNGFLVPCLFLRNWMMDPFYVKGTELAIHTWHFPLFSCVTEIHCPSGSSLDICVIWPWPTYFKWILPCGGGVWKPTLKYTHVTTKNNSSKHTPAVTLTYLLVGWKEAPQTLYCVQTSFRESNYAVYTTNHDVSFLVVALQPVL